MKTKQITKVYAPTGIYLYIMTNMENSSKCYGCCEVCGEYADTVHLQSEYVQIPSGHNGSSWSAQQDGTAFGHECCLFTIRKEGGKATELRSITLGRNTSKVTNDENALL